MFFSRSSLPSLVFNVEQIELLLKDNNLISGFSLDGPTVNSTGGALDFTICGWIVAGKEKPLMSIEINVDGFTMKRTPINVPRPDVVQALGLAGNHHCGFDTKLGLVGLPNSFDVEIVAVLRGDNQNDRVKVPLANIKGSKQADFGLQTNYEPLVLTAIGRSGTTWLMKLLTQHAELLTSDFYPYEVKQSAYWMQQFKIMTDPADFSFSSHPDKFDVTMNSIGANPYTYPHYLNQYKNPEDFANYYSTTMVSNAARFATQQIDEFYRLVAKGENKPSAKYFAEKFVPSHLQSVYRDVYPEMKEIILVRDFRDVLCSAKSFNEKRNSVAFGRERVNDDFEWVQHVSKAGIRRMANALEERKSTAYLLKYEDLILEPEKTLQGLFEYVGIASDTDSVAKVIKQASISNNSMEAHKTSKDPAASIGRWKTEMSAEMQKLCAEEMGEHLSAFGYDV